jgi:hypothetical protein
MEKRLNAEVYIKELEAEIVKLKDLVIELVQHIEEDFPRESGTKHLWTSVDDAKEMLYGATSAYVDQD